MSDHEAVSAVTHGQFFEAMNQVLDRIDTKHSSLRAFVGERTDRLEKKLDDHVKDHDAVTRDVAVLKDARAEEQRRAGLRIALICALATIAATVVVGVLSHFKVF